MRTCQAFSRCIYISQSQWCQFLTWTCSVMKPLSTSGDRRGTCQVWHSRCMEIYGCGYAPSKKLGIFKLLFPFSKIFKIASDFWNQKKEGEGLKALHGTEIPAMLFHWSSACGLSSKSKPPDDLTWKNPNSAARWTLASNHPLPLSVWSSMIKLFLTCSKQNQALFIFLIILYQYWQILKKTQNTSYTWKIPPTIRFTIYLSNVKLIPCRLPRTWQIPWHDSLPGHGMPWGPPWRPHPLWAERSCDLITMTNTWSELMRGKFLGKLGQVLCKSDQIYLPRRLFICVLHRHWQASTVPSPLRAALEKNPMIDMIRSPVW